jgi:putative transposase
MTLGEIRESTNKAWVLGSDQFKKKIARKINRPVQSKGHGGDRKSEDYKRGFNG